MHLDCDVLTEELAREFLRDLKFCLRRLGSGFHAVHTISDFASLRVTNECNGYKDHGGYNLAHDSRNDLHQNDGY